MTHVAPHQRPWFHEVFCGPATGQPLGDALAAVGGARATWLRRCIAVVGAESGYWREERLIEGLDGSLVLEIDSHRGGRPVAEPLPAELSKTYDGLVATLKKASKDWPATGGLHREPGRARGDTLVVIDAATLEGRALLGETAVEAFKRTVYGGFDPNALRR
jgi:hypothetical protein